MKREAVGCERAFGAARLTYTLLGISAAGRGSVLRLEITGSDKHYIHWSLSQCTTALIHPSESIFKQTQF